MQVAALYDIHANLPALEAVLEDVQRRGANLIVIGGDVVPGPMPRDTLDLLLSLKIPTQFIRGNGDRVTAASMAGEEPNEVPEQFRPTTYWTSEQLRPEHGPIMAGWPATLQLSVPGLGEVLFCHATPRNDRDVFTKITPEERLVPHFAETGAEVVVCGHTHMQFDRMICGVRVVNAGSVGMPYGEPGAYWLLLGPAIELKRTEYDLNEAARRILASGYPDAVDFAENNVIKPATEEEALTVFEPMALT